MPESDVTTTAIAQGVAQALSHLLASPDIADAIRQGVRDGIWHAAAANATDTPPAGHAD